MIFGRGSLPAFFTATAALRMARVWIFTKSGIISPSRQPRRPEHRVLLVHRLDRREQLLVLLGGAASPALVTLTSCSSRFGRNSWSGGSIRRMTTGRPSIAGEDALEVALLEDLELGHRGVERRDRLGLVGRERLAGRGLRLGPGRDVGDEDRATHDLEPLALAEHVLGAAQADALGAVAAGLRGLLGLVGVGPDLHPADLVGPAEDLLELGLVLEAGLDGRQRRRGRPRPWSRRR